MQILEILEIVGSLGVRAASAGAVVSSMSRKKSHVADTQEHLCTIERTSTAPKTLPGLAYAHLVIGSKSSTMEGTDELQHEAPLLVRVDRRTVTSCMQIADP